MSDTKEINKRIAKNTLLLYVRMFFLMAINLYTSRVILQVLGIEDYGVYNAIAGFVAMFSMITGSITSAISRFLTYVLGQGDSDKLKKVFSTALIIQITLAILIVLLVEAVGVWFLNTHMTIPIGREFAANCVLQFSLLTFVLNLWSTPYNAALIAHERMGAFAYIGIFEGVANLAIAWLVKFSNFDSLILYATLMCIVALVTRLIYNIYCKRHFQECSVKWIFDKSLFKEMFGFAGWNFIGSVSGLLREQGINVLFNVYYGPVINAARGVASQVQTAVTKFSQGFFMAVQPQITKTYANNMVVESHDLVLRSSRLAFFLLMAFIIPIIAETHFILDIWLYEVPGHTVTFIRIILTLTLIETFSTPLVYLMLATGDIKKYQIVVGCFNLLNFPVAWIILCFGGSAELAQFSVIVFSIIGLILRLVMLKNMTFFPVRLFLTNTILRCIIALILCALPAYFMTYCMPEGIVRFFLNMILIELLVLALTASIGLNSGEKAFVLSKMKSIIKG